MLSNEVKLTVNINLGTSPASPHTLCPHLYSFGTIRHCNAMGTDPWFSKSIENFRYLWKKKKKGLRARDLIFWDDAHQSLYVMCHMSRVTWHMTCDTWQVKHEEKKNGGASWSRVCYLRGLPRLVFLNLTNIFLGLLFSVVQICGVLCSIVQCFEVLISEV